MLRQLWNVRPTLRPPVTTTDNAKHIKPKATLWLQPITNQSATQAYLDSVEERHRVGVPMQPVPRGEVEVSLRSRHLQNKKHRSRRRTAACWAFIGRLATYSESTLSRVGAVPAAPLGGCALSFACETVEPMVVLKHERTKKRGGLTRSKVFRHGRRSRRCTNCKQG